MATYTRKKLSESTDGQPITVDSNGEAVHTATATDTATVWDEVWLWAMNYSSNDVDATITFGANSFVKTLTAKGGPQLIIPGWILHDEHTVTVAATTGTTRVAGYINEIT